MPAAIPTVNGFLAAAEAVSEGSWARVSEAALPEQPGLVEGVDFPAVALAEARWVEDTLRLRLHPQNDEVLGRPTSFRVTGLDDPDRWRVEGDARLAPLDGELVVETSARDHRLTLRRAER